MPWLGSGEGERFVAVDAFDDATVLSLRTGGLTALRVLPRDPSSPSGHGEPWDVAVDQPVHSIGLGDNPEPAQRAIQVVVESWATPRTVLDVDLATRERTLLKRQPVLGDFDAANYAEHREWATASDGTLVPVSVVRRVGVEADGTNPGVVTAYGSYEISSDPYFSVARLSLLDRGRRLRRRARARRRRDGAALVRRRQAAREDQHLHRHPRRRRPPGGLGVGLT